VGGALVQISSVKSVGHKTAFIDKLLLSPILERNLKLLI